MPIIKIINIVGAGGRIDYKGLDISKIVGGTQLYPEQENTAYFHYEGAVVEHEDTSIITQSEYDVVRNRIENAPKPITDAERIQELEQSQAEQDDLLMSIMLGGI